MATYEVNVEEVEPMSRTYQYRKVMKPMLERKRRARINKCLDELKDLMVGALQSEGESITKLEKADVLELTVRHLRKLKQHHALAIPAQNHAHEKFRAGFGHCATEVRRFVQAVPGVDMHVSGRLLNHLGQWMSQMDKITPTTVNQGISPMTSPISSPSSIPVNVPKVYTPPASPDTKPLIPSHTTRPASPQPLSLIMKAQVAPSAAAYPANIYTAPQQPSKSTQLQQQHQFPPHQLNVVINHLPLPVSSSSPPSAAPQSPSPSAHSFRHNEEPINYSPRHSTGVKIELPQGSPVWRPWSA